MDWTRIGGAPKLRDRKISLRNATPADRAVLEEVYASTRAEELAPVPWPPETKRAFLAQQFAAQDASYRQHYAGADFLLVAVDELPAGRLYLHERGDEIRIMDIALLPPFRARGLGGALIREVLNEGARLRTRVTIHVETFNPARRLYERLGFVETSLTPDPVYRLFEWRPPLRPGG